MRKDRKNRGILWCILFVMAAVIMLAVLELGKHTILGWGLTAALLAGFFLLRGKKLGQKGRLLRLGAWCGMLVLFAGILWVSWPPVRAIPAVKGKNGGVTEPVHVAQGDLTGVLTEDGRVEIEEKRVPFDKAAYIRAFMQTGQYREANVWSRVILRELATAREHVCFFLSFAEQYAKDIGDDRRPYATDTWEKAFEIWEQQQEKNPAGIPRPE